MRSIIGFGLYTRFYGKHNHSAYLGIEDPVKTSVQARGVLIQHVGVLFKDTQEAAGLEEKGSHNELDQLTRAHDLSVLILMITMINTVPLCLTNCTWYLFHQFSVN